MISDEELLRDCRRHHSPLQMDSFITVRSGMTRYGCLHQALRELHCRRTSLRQLRTELTKAWWRSLVFRVLWFVFPNAAENAHEIFSEIEHEIFELTAERDRFRAQVLALRNAMEQIDGATFPLDEQTMDRLDRERWSVELKANAAVELLTSFPRMLSRSTVEIMRALPRNMRHELTIALAPPNHDATIQWFLNYETPMPEVARLECSGSSDSPKLSPDTSPMDSIACQQIECGNGCLSANPASIAAG